MAKKRVKATPFDRLVKLLEDNGYAVKITPQSRWTKTGKAKDKCGLEDMLVRLPKKHDFRFATVKGKGIEAGFCEPNGGDSYRYIDGKIAADNEGCFDKWSKCPLCLDFPKDADQEVKLLELLSHLGSTEGYTLSNGYDYLGEGNNPYHY